MADDLPKIDFSTFLLSLSTTALMQRDNVGSVVIVDEDRVVGIITDRGSQLNVIALRRTEHMFINRTGRRGS